MTYSIWFLIVPLFLFVLVDSFAAMKTALIVAALGAFAEVGFTYYSFGEIDFFSIASVFLVLLMCGLAFLNDSRKIFYLKPAILSLAFGGFLTVAHLMGNYVLLDGYTKYAHLFEIDPAQIAMLGEDRVNMMFQNASLSTGIALLLHSVVAAYAALRLTRWWWFMVAGVGAYIFLFAGMMIAGFM